MEQQLQSAPRVDAADLHQYQGQVVRVVGKVEQGNHPVAVLGCGQDGSVRVQVKMAPGNQYNSAFVEVMGRVNYDGMEEIMSYDLGDTFDMGNYQQLLTFSAGQYRPLFA
jgi:hypothetical protein